MAEDTWFTHDLPVLDAVVVYMDRELGRSFPQLADIARETGIPVDDVARSARRLDGSFIDLRVSTGPPGHWHVGAVSSDARVATGQWPSPDTFADRLLAALEAQAEAEPDQEKRSRLRSAISVLVSTAQGVAENVMTAAVLRAAGLR